MKNKNQGRLWIVLTVLIILRAAFCGCIEEKPPKYAKPSETIQETSASEQQLELLKKVTHGEVWTFTKNWDEDAEDDGIAVYITLKDANDKYC